MILALVAIVYAIIGRRLFLSTSPQKFGSFPQALYTVRHFLPPPQTSSLNLRPPSRFLPFAPSRHLLSLRVRSSCLSAIRKHPSRPIPLFGHRGRFKWPLVEKRTSASAGLHRPHPRQVSPKAQPHTLARGPRDSARGAGVIATNDARLPARRTRIGPEPCVVQLFLSWFARDSSLE